MTELEQITELCRELPADARRQVLALLRTLREQHGLDPPETGGQRAPQPGVLEQVGFVGSLDAEPSLSEQYKEVISETLTAKHDHR